MPRVGKRRRRRLLISRLLVRRYMEASASYWALAVAGGSRCRIGYRSTDKPRANISNHQVYQDLLVLVHICVRPLAIHLHFSSPLNFSTRLSRFHLYPLSSTPSHTILSFIQDHEPSSTSTLTLFTHLGRLTTSFVPYRFTFRICDLIAVYYISRRQPLSCSLSESCLRGNNHYTLTFTSNIQHLNAVRYSFYPVPRTL